MRGRAQGYFFGNQGQFLLHQELCNNSSCLSKRALVIERGTGWWESGGCICPPNNLQFVLSVRMKGLLEGKRAEREQPSGRRINPILLLSLHFSFFFFSPFTSFQAESLLVRRKVWRGNESAGGEGGEGGGEEDQEERGRQGDKPQQEAKRHTHTHTPRVCVSERETVRTRG